MAKYKSDYKNFRGWTEWIWPVPNYKLACCDCGLVHDVRLVAFKVKNAARGTFVVTGTTSRRKIRVGMKVKRNNRSTALMRRKGKK